MMEELVEMDQKGPSHITLHDPSRIAESVVSRTELR